MTKEFQIGDIEFSKAIDKRGYDIYYMKCSKRKRISKWKYEIALKLFNKNTNNLKPVLPGERGSKKHVRSK